MKERGQKILHQLREADLRKFEDEWKSSKWSHLKSFTEVGIKPNTKIISLWNDFGGKGEIYVQYLIENKFSFEERQEFWRLMLSFQNDVGDRAKIEDFQDLAPTDLEDLRFYSWKEKRILERVFASSTK